MRYRFSRLAVKDLEDIWEYTAKNWSEAQADNYYTEMIAKIELLCDHPEAVERIDYIARDCRKLRVLSHLLIYRFEASTIFIERILHQSMDFETHLK